MYVYIYVTCVTDSESPLEGSVTKDKSEMYIDMTGGYIICKIIVYSVYIFCIFSVMSVQYSWLSVMLAWLVLSMSCRKPCIGIQEDDIRETVWCENRLDSRAGLSFCGKQPFNPAKATCCKVHHKCNTTGNDHTFVGTAECG